MFRLNQRLERKDPKFNEVLQNIEQTQKLIEEKKYLFGSYFGRKNSFDSLNVHKFHIDSLVDVFESPITSLMSLGVGVIMLLHPLFLQIETSPDVAVAVLGKTLLLSALQLLFFGLFFASVFLSFMKFLSKDDK
jgi:hypothetical protein